MFMIKNIPISQPSIFKTQTQGSSLNQNGNTQTKCKAKY